MELKDPMFDLLSSLEQIVFKDAPQTVTRSQKSNPFTEFELVEPVTEKWGNRRIPVRHCFAVMPRTSAVDFPSKPPILQAMDALISTGHKPNMQSTEMRTIRESK